MSAGAPCLDPHRKPVSGQLDRLQRQTGEFHPQRRFLHRRVAAESAGRASPLRNVSWLDSLMWMAGADPPLALLPVAWQFLEFGPVDLVAEAELLDLSRAGER